MKKMLIAVFVALVLSLPAPSDAQFLQGTFAGQISGTPTNPPFSCSSSGDFACETFDCSSGCQTCVDDASSQGNCFIVWTAAGTGTITNQGAGLETGTNYGKTISATAENYKQAYTSFTAKDSMSFFTLANIDTLSFSSTTQAPLTGLYSSGGSYVCVLGVVYSDPDIKFTIHNGSGWQTPISSPTVAADTLYYVWIDYIKNTAGTGCKVFISTTTSKPGSPTAQYTSPNTQISRAYLNGYNISTRAFSPVTFDRVRMNATGIGDYVD